MTTRTSSARLALLGAVTVGAIVASATDAIAVADTSLTGPLAAASVAAASRCPQNSFWNYVDIDPVLGSVVSVSGMPCRRAARILSWTMLTRDGKLAPSEGAPLGWTCQRVGEYYGGVRYRCWKGSASFRAMVGA